MRFTRKGRLEEAERVHEEREEARRAAVERLQRYATEDADRLERERRLADQRRRS